MSCICLQPNCLTSNPDDYKFCHKCGKKLLLGDRYLTLKKIGEGGFGITFLAIDKHRWDAPCVIKQFIPMEAASAALKKCIELFEQESKLLQRLGKHPQIPDLFAFFEQEERLYLIQEFIDGEDLGKELQRKGRFSESEVTSFLNSLLPVIDFIHQQKIYHRDIKLDNIIRRQDGVLMLIDFGISKQTSSTIATKMGTIAGTPGYAPPEQMRGLTHPSGDLYSLAVTAIRMLTGYIPEEKNGTTVDELFDILNMEFVLLVISSVILNPF
jgi:serine/threonine protein kinase